MTRNSERGSALLLVTIITLVVVGISGAYFSVSWYNNKKSMNDVSALSALYLAESAASMFVMKANLPAANMATLLNDAPLPLGAGTYTIPAAKTNNYVGDPNANGNYFRFVAIGKVSGIERSVDVLLSRQAGGVYWNAVYAGNKSNDPAYSLTFAGNDSVEGDMYSGNNFSATGNATLIGEGGTGNSTITHKGSGYTETTTSTPNNVQGPQEDLSLPRDGAGRTTWEEKAAALRTPGARRDGSGVAYIDVKHDLTTRGAPGTWGGSNSNGGRADFQFNAPSHQATEPAHIFRMNPTSTNGTTNRTESYEYTKKVRDDFYLEDPTASGVNNRSIGGGNSVNGDPNSTSVTIAGTEANNAVYFIDGNMRVSGEPIKSYQLTPASGTGNLQMTMVVKGNVSMTDNMLYPTFESQNDAVAIIAVTHQDFPNATAANFMSATSPLPVNTLGQSVSNYTIAQFVTDYNTRTQPARDAGRIIPALPTSNPSTWTAAQRERAAQEYNKAYGSGNVYFGDPGSGTVENFQAFMYAENNFYATNLNSGMGSGGTQRVEIFGNMTAGNQVSMVREQFDNNGNPAAYIPLNVQMDTKIKSPTGTKPPALPSTPSFGTGTWFVATWRQTAN